MTFAQGLIMGLFFIIAWALFLVGSEVKRLRDAQREIRDELMLIRVAQPFGQNATWHGPHVVLVKHPETGGELLIHCWNGNVTHCPRSQNDDQQEIGDA